MKTLFAFAGLMMVALNFGSTTQAHAYGFQLQAEVDISPTLVKATVQNSLGIPVVCRVQVMGVRGDGFTQTAWAQLALPAYGYEYAYVYTSYPFNFVDGQGVAYCQTVGGF